MLDVLLPEAMITVYMHLFTISGEEADAALSSLLQ
jgi:hypothetical protein